MSINLEIAAESSIRSIIAGVCRDIVPWIADPVLHRHIERDPPCDARLRLTLKGSDIVMSFTESSGSVERVVGQIGTPKKGSKTRKRKASS